MPTLAVNNNARRMHTSNLPHRARNQVMPIAHVPDVRGICTRIIAPPRNHTTLNQSLTNSAWECAGPRFSRAGWLTFRSLCCPRLR